jgi:hypothetical protein
MRPFFALLVLVLLLALTAACTAPPPTEEQLRAYAQYAELRATDAAASEIIAAAKATEAAAVQQIAQATAAAQPPPAVITATAILTPTLVITATAPLTVTGESTAAMAPLTATVEITATATPTPTAIVTPTALPTATASPTPSALPTPTPTATATATATAPPTPTPRAVATVAITPTATLAAAATPTALLAATLGPTSPATPSAVSPWPALIPDAPSQAITSTLAAPTPTPTPAGRVVVTSQQANLRGGPGMAFDVAATARQGDVLDVFGSDAAQNWWRVCCIDGAAGWISRTIVRFEGDPQAVPVAGPLLPDDLRASWAMRWECHGRGCKQEVCTGQSQAAALRVSGDRWLEVQRDAAWDDNCGEPEDWLTQVDRYTGRERAAGSAPLFNIWEGAKPGPANRSVNLAGAQRALWCTDTRTQEVPQAGGWAAAFEGQACYDVESGVLALMQYVKRWLFTGTAGGQTFDREYFGDYEVIQQVLLETNAPLSGSSN